MVLAERRSSFGYGAETVKNGDEACAVDGGVRDADRPEGTWAVSPSNAAARHIVLPVPLNADNGISYSPELVIK